MIRRPCWEGLPVAKDDDEKQSRWVLSNATIIAIATLITAIAALIAALSNIGPA